MKLLSKSVPFMMLLFLAAGCQFLDSQVGDPPAENLTWVAQDYSGGEQCDSDDYEPPNVELLLLKEGIAVYETEIHHQPVCAACGCPDYSATHYAQIKKEELDEAEELGFRQEQPPEDDEASDEETDPSLAAGLR